MQKHVKILAFLTTITLCMFCFMAGGFRAALAAGEDTLQIKIISTSDVHGKLLPYDYEQNIPAAAGSLSQISSAVRGIADENTIGKLEIENSPDGRYTNIRSLTEADLSAVFVPVSADE